MEKGVHIHLKTTIMFVHLPVLFESLNKHKPIFDLPLKFQ